MLLVTTPRQSYYFYSAFIVLAFCLVLFSLDRETKSFSDLINPGNLFALFLYFIPTYALCSLLYNLFQRRNSKNSPLLALSIGIPVGFTFVIIALAFLMGRI